MRNFMVAFLVLGSISSFASTEGSEELKNDQNIPTLVFKSSYKKHSVLIRRNDNNNFPSANAIIVTTGMKDNVNYFSRAGFMDCRAGVASALTCEITNRVGSQYDAVGFEIKEDGTRAVLIQANQEKTYLYLQQAQN